ncbi:MAG: polysaccharide biosynthesis protein [Clostridia bacterium]|nr:polysaccharide biosynthesis protein [Clostridia bacterium]
MDKVKNEKKPSFMKNVMILISSQIIIKILGLIYRLVIINIDGFGDVGNGYYSTGYNLYALLLTLSSIGLPSVVSKLVSERLAVEDKVGAQRVFKVAMIFFVSIGIVLSVLLFFGAEFIANNVYKTPDVKYVLKVLAPAIAFVSALSIFRGYFMGQNNMKPSSISQTLEQFLNCVLSITFVYMAIGKESYIMAAAGNLSTTLAVIITFIYFSMYYKANKIKPEKGQISKEKSKTNRQILKIILTISIPITLGSIISVINPVLDNTTVTNCIKHAFSNLITSPEVLQQKAMELIGMLSKAETLIGLPLAINLAFSTALIPTISASMAKKDYTLAEKRIRFSVFASIIIIIPCAIGYIVLSQNIFRMLYPTASNGAGILQILAISMMFMALSQTLNGALYGISKVRIPVIALSVGVFVKLFLNILLISNPNINIYGAAIGSVACQFIAFVISFVSLNRSIKLNLQLKQNLVKPLIAGIIMGIGVFAVNIILNNVVGAALNCIISIMVGALIYIILIFTLRVLSEEDIRMIPFGSKIYNQLVKYKIYKQN